MTIKTWDGKFLSVRCDLDGGTPMMAADLAGAELVTATRAELQRLREAGYDALVSSYTALAAEPEAVERRGADLREAEDAFRDAPPGPERDKLGRALEAAREAEAEYARALGEDPAWAADKAQRMHDRLGGVG